MTTINDLSRVTSASSADLLPLYSNQQGDARAISLADLLSYFNDSFASPSTTTTYFSPTSSGYVYQMQAATANQWLVITPSGAFATGTIVLPISSAAVDGQEILVTSTQSVAALTVNGYGATVVGAPTALGTGGFFSLRYSKFSNTWFCIAQSLGGVGSVFTNIQVSGSILDANGNAILSFFPTAAATRRVQIGNDAGADEPFITVTGPEANIDLNLFGKGAGGVLIKGQPAVTTVDVQTLTNKTLTAPVINNGTQTQPTINAATLVTPIIGSGTLAQLQAAALALGNPAGLRGTCTNSTTTTFYANITGGGANIVPAFFDGANWKVGG